MFFAVFEYCSVAGKGKRLNMFFDACVEYMQVTIHQDALLFTRTCRFQFILHQHMSRCNIFCSLRVYSNRFMQTGLRLIMVIIIHPKHHHVESFALS